MSLVGVRNGDVITVRRVGYRGDIRVEHESVTRVGRTYLYTGDKWTERRYRISDGMSEHGTIGFTADGYAAFLEREALEQKVAKMTDAYDWVRRLSIGKLRSLAELLESP